MEEAELQLQLLKKVKIKLVQARLEAKENAQKAVDEKLGLDKALAETRLELSRLEESSAEKQKQLESQVEELERARTAAGVREIDLSEKQRHIMEQLSDAECRYKAAETEAERQKEAKDDAEASLAKEKQLLRSAEQQMQQLKGDIGEQLKDVELRIEAAKIEADFCRNAMNDAQASLAKTEQSRQSPEQQLQQMRQKTCEEQLKDAERQTEAAKIEADICRKAMSDMKAALTTEKQWRQNMQQQLYLMKWEASEQLDDAERRIWEAKLEAAACQKAKTDTEAAVEKEKQLCQNLRQQLQQMEHKMCEDLREAERRIWEEKDEVDFCRKAKKDVEAFLTAEMESRESLRLQLKQMQRQAREQLYDAKCRIEAEKFEADVCRKAKYDAEASLAEEKRSRKSLLRLQQETKEQARSLDIELSQSKRELNRLHQQQDYRKSYAEGLHFTCLNIRYIVL